MNLGLYQNFKRLSITSYERHCFFCNIKSSHRSFKILHGGFVSTGEDDKCDAIFWPNHAMWLRQTKRCTFDNWASAKIDQTRHNQKCEDGIFRATWSIWIIFRDDDYLMDTILILEAAIILFYHMRNTLNKKIRDHENINWKL